MTNFDRMPTIEELMKENNGRLANAMTEDEKVQAEFVRQFSIETTKMLIEKQGVTLFRELPVSAQINCMLQGCMMSLAAITMPGIDQKNDEAKELARQFLKLHVDVGIANAEVTIENAKMMMRKMGIKLPGGG